MSFWLTLFIVTMIVPAIVCALTAWCSCVLGGKADAAKRDAILRRWEEGQ